MSRLQISQWHDYMLELSNEKKKECTALATRSTVCWQMSRIAVFSRAMTDPEPRKSQMLTIAISHHHVHDIFLSSTLAHQLKWYSRHDSSSEQYLFVAYDVRLPTYRQDRSSSPSIPRGRYILLIGQRMTEHLSDSHLSISLETVPSRKNA